LSGVAWNLHLVAGACAAELFTRGPCGRRFIDPGRRSALSRMIEAKLSFLISGGTGSGNTVLHRARL